MRYTPEYKGYIGSMEYVEERKLFYGKIIGIEALISFEGDTEEEMIEDYHEAVDGYLDYCNRNGIEPEKPMENHRTYSDLEAFAEWLKTQDVGLDSTTKTVLVAVKQGEDSVWRNAVEMFKASHAS